MGETFLIFGYSIQPLVAVAILAGLCVIIGYVLGANFSTRGLRLIRPARKPRPEDSGVLRGINSLLANNTDQAIKELSRVVEQESGNVETYITLGHLFRTKGQFDRAVAIRQSIIARPGLPAPVRIQALYDMGVDYHKGGFLVRAIEAFEQVLNEDARHKPALAELVQVFEELKDWDRALDAQRRLNKLTGRTENNVLAHLKTERGKQLAAAGDLSAAKAAFKKALGWNKKSVNALLSLGDVHLAEGDLKRALAVWRKIAQAEPSLCFLALERVIGREWGAGETPLIDEFIVGAAAESKDPRALLTAARHLAARGKEKETVETLGRILESSPCYLPTHQDLGQIHLDRGNMDEILNAYQALLECLPDVDHRFHCRRCGWSADDVFWKCPSCRRWDTLKTSD